MTSFPPSLAALTLLLAACEAGGAAPAADEWQQTGSCQVPRELKVASAAMPADNIPDAPMTGYLLALSWSPEFCRFRADVPKHAPQCRNNRFGLIVHGLWPQSARWPHPRYCSTAEPVAREILAEHFCMTPDAELMMHQWAAHGSCAFDDPDAYFDRAAAVRARFEEPDLITLSRRNGLTAGDVRSAFAADADLGASMIALDIKRGWLREVRICLGIDFEPRVCTRGEYGPPDSAPVSIWRGGRR